MNFISGWKQAFLSFSSSLLIALALVASPAGEALGEDALLNPASPDRSSTYRAVLNQMGAVGNTVEVTVRDASTGEAIEAANVLVGERAGQPFADNVKPTGSNGAVSFEAPQLASGSWNVSATKAGYQAIHVAATNARVLELFLQPVPLEDDFVFFRGKFSFWPTGLTRSDLEAGLFVPAFRVSTMMNFDLSQVVSTHSVEIPVAMGQTANVPGNFVMPPQDKTYSFFRIHLEKPEFAMPVAKHSQSYMSALVGNVPLSQAVSRIRAKDYIGVVNLMKFTHVGNTDWMEALADDNFDITTTTELNASTLVSKHGSIPSGYDLVAFHLWDPKDDARALIPLDIKSRARTGSILSTERLGLFPVYEGISAFLDDKAPTPPTGEIRLADFKDPSVAGSHYVFSAYLDQAQFSARPLNALKFSAALNPVQGGPGQRSVETNQYLSLIQQQSVSSDRRTYRFTMDANAPTQPEYLLLNIFSVSTDAETGVENRRLLWTSFLPPSTREIQLPELAGVNFHSQASVSSRIVSWLMRTINREERLYWQVLAVRREVAPTPGMWDSVTTVRNLRNISHATKLF